MKKIDFSQSVSLLANIGVVAGIALLAIELQQNNELMRAQQRFNRLSISAGSATLIAESPELAAAVAKVNDSTKDFYEINLTPGEQAQVGGYYTRILDNQQWTYREMSREELPIKRWKQMASSNGWQNAWEYLKFRYDLDFVQWMEDNVADQ